LIPILGSARLIECRVLLKTGRLVNRSMECAQCGGPAVPGVTLPLSLESEDENLELETSRRRLQRLCLDGTAESQPKTPLSQALSKTDLPQCKYVAYCLDCYSLIAPLIETCDVCNKEVTAREASISETICVTNVHTLCSSCVFYCTDCGLRYCEPCRDSFNRHLIGTVDSSTWFLCYDCTKPCPSCRVMSIAKSKDLCDICSECRAEVLLTVSQRRTT